jgi:glycosyltransferase involved in cell wall biosynthesis
MFQTVMSAQYLPDWYRGHTIWILEDPLALKTHRMLPIYPWYSRPLHRISSNRLKSYDKREAPRFGRVTFVNKEDALEYKHIVPGACTDWVPHCVDEKKFAPSDDIARKEGMIVITGNMYHLPNVDAVELFCRDVFPLVCEQVPSATLWLVGANPAKRISTLSRDPRIKVTGFVPDVRTYLRQAVVSACPVRLRIGTQTKILEALACGTPVVTSSEGNHGIAGVSGHDLYVADRPQEFADHVVTLLQRHRWGELSRNGRQFVLDNFTSEKSAAKLEQILEQVVGERTENSVSL